MLNEFKQYLLGIGKSENTALNYCDKVKLYFKWCLDSFGSEPQQLYRANLKVIQDIMGHRNIETTMDIYAEATDQKKQESFNNLSKLDIF